MSISEISDALHEEEVENTVICAECGCIVDPNDDDVYEDEEGNFYCIDCFGENFFECGECGRIYPIEEGTYIESEDIAVCEDCCSLYYTTCECCDDIVRNNDTRHVHAYGNVCENCIEYSGDFGWCEDCGELFCYDDLIYHEYHDAYYCPDCYNEHDSGEISEYGYKPAPIFSFDISELDENDRLFIGFELETDYGRRCSDFAREINESNVTASKTNLLYCKEDGSLDDGVEIVSHPSTLKYFKKVEVFEKISKINSDGDYNFKSDMTSTCGLHTHVSRSFFGENEEEQKINIAKVILLVHRFWESHLQNFTRRRGDYHWCQLNEISNIFESDIADEVIIADKCTKQSSRYVAINLYNSDTIEFRLFKGSLNVETDYAALEFVDRICRFAKQNPIDVILNCTWEDVFGEDVLAEFGDLYKELVSYCKRRELYGIKPHNIPIIKLRKGYHHEGETIYLPPLEKIAKYFDEVGEYMGENCWDVRSAEGHYMHFCLSNFSHAKDKCDVYGVGTFITIRHHYKGNDGIINLYEYIDFPRDILEDILAIAEQAA